MCRATLDPIVHRLLSNIGGWGRYQACSMARRRSQRWWHCCRRRIERDNHHEIVPLAAGSSNAPRRIQPACIAMQQKRNHHARIERRLAQPTHIAAHDRLEIQALPHQPNDKPRDVVLRHEVPHIRRQKQRLIDIPGAKVLAHSPSLNQTCWDLNSDYSDRLLANRQVNTASQPPRTLRPCCPLTGSPSHIRLYDGKEAGTKVRGEFPQSVGWAAKPQHRHNCDPWSSKRLPFSELSHWL